MKEYKKSLEHHEHEQDVNIKSQYNKTHHAKKEDHHHETINGISYSEHHCMKLNGYRPEDRPYGNESRTSWKLNGILGDSTYSAKKASEWIKAGLEVREYNAKGELRKVHNARPSTTAMLNKLRVSFAK